MLKAVLPLVLGIIMTLVATGRAEESAAQEAQAPAIQGRVVANRVVDSLSAQGVGALAGETVDAIIAEGDSWFSYPGVDVLGALGGGRLSGGVRYAVYSAASAGDTVESMAYDGDQLEDFAAEFFKARDSMRSKTVRSVKAILLSGGGNDIAGPEFHILLNHADSATGAISPLDIPVAQAFIERIARSLESLIGTAQGFSDIILGPNNKIPILIHGYAPPVPDGRPFLIGWPLPGPWLQPGFSAKGYLRDTNSLNRNTDVMAALIGMFNKRLSQVPANVKATVPDVRYVDVTKLLTNAVPDDAYKSDWSNELHPRDAAFVRVAEALHQRMK